MSSTPDPPPSHPGSRRGPARAIAILIGIVAVGLGARILLTPVDVTCTTSVEFVASAGPAEFYIGGHRLGSAPVEFDPGLDHPAVVDVDRDFDMQAISAQRMLRAIGREDLEPLGAPDALPPGVASGGIAGQVRLANDASAGQVQLSWWKMVVRRPDRSLELVYPCIVVDEISGTRRGWLLRIRRNDALTIDARFGQRAVPKPGLSRTLLRHAHYDATAVITVGARHDPARIEEEVGAGTWWLGRFVPGTEVLDDPVPIRKDD